MQRPSSNKNANPKGIGSPPSVANRGLYPQIPRFVSHIHKFVGLEAFDRAD
jgi:hypothetical protein